MYSVQFTCSDLAAHTQKKKKKTFFKTSFKIYTFNLMVKFHTIE